jgi:hypothetical protein
MNAKEKTLLVDELPRRRSDRISGRKYISKNEVVIWDGRILRCGHNKRKSRCYECKGEEPSIRGIAIHISHPKVAAELHNVRNNSLRYRGNLVEAKNLPAGSNYQVWWKCTSISETPCNHEWEALINNRCRNKDSSGCPFCAHNSCLHSDGHNSMRNTNEKLTRTFHPTKNAPKTPDNIVAGHGKNLFWICDKCDNVWKAKGSTRLREGGSGCGFCESGYLHSDGRNIFGFCGDKGLIREWHPTKNGELTPFHILDGGADMVWWKCSKCPHEWRTRLVERTNGRGCKSCIRGDLNSSGTNSLAYVDPLLSSEFLLEKNSPLTPYDLTSGNSSEKVWWKCKTISDEPCGHEWKTTPASRTEKEESISKRKKTGCPVCNQGYLHFEKTNSLAVLRPDIANEWHLTKNGDLTPEDVVLGNNGKVWWYCKKHDYSWHAQINSRTRTKTYGCTKCQKKNQTLLYNILEKIYPREELFWDYKHEDLVSETSGNRLELDIWIPSLSMGFEYQGEGHYYPQDQYGKKKQKIFQDTIRRDEEKKKLCKKYNILLIEIPYTWNQSIEYVRDIIKNC